MPRSSTSPASRRTPARPLVLAAIGVAAAGIAAAGMWVLLSNGAEPAKEQAPGLHGPDPLSLQGHVWTQQPEPRFPIPPYARFLAGVRIVLDPGHGGRGDIPGFKRGPTGLREAEVNLRVARYLREFLLAVDAEVTMTRDADVYLEKDNAADLRKRAAIANRARAHLLLSIHHNAAASPDANYTTVFYHGTPDDSPASLCAARYLLAGIDDALRLERVIGCALQSDFAIYEDEGFAILRHARVPAVLTESSFHSNPAEEDRLRDPLYNRREAHGLFLGLARWARAGLPAAKVVAAARAPGGELTSVTVELDDGLSHRGGMGQHLPKVLADSVIVRWNGRRIGFDPDWARNRLRIRVPPGASSTTRELYVDFQNVFGQHVLHPRLDLQHTPQD